MKNEKKIYENINAFHGRQQRRKHANVDRRCFTALWWISLLFARVVRISQTRLIVGHITAKL